MIAFLGVSLSPELERLIAALLAAVPMVALACLVLSRIEGVKPDGR